MKSHEITWKMDNGYDWPNKQYVYCASQSDHDCVSNKLANAGSLAIEK